jgi:hypothetical protein
MKCNNSDCEKDATGIMAWPTFDGRCLFVAPFCSKHRMEVIAHMGGLPAAGPALSDEAKEIEGIR